MTIGVVIATYGTGGGWAQLAGRALASVEAQTAAPDQVVRLDESHSTLSQVRNNAISRLKTDWVIVLDADDELDHRYIERMVFKGFGDVRQPSTLGVVNGVDDDVPVLIQRKPNMLIGNHLVIGSMFRRDQFEAVGGFRELPVLEDWDLFIRLWLAGAVFGECPEAIYRVHVRPGSRNTDHQLHGEIYREIQDRYTPMALQKGLL